VTVTERRQARWRAARPAVVWTLGAFVVGVVIAVAATASLAQAQEACLMAYPAVPCPDASDPRVAWLTFAFFGVPLIWLLGLMLLAVRAMTGARG